MLSCSLCQDDTRGDKNETNLLYHALNQWAAGGFAKFNLNQCQFDRYTDGGALGGKCFVGSQHSQSDFFTAFKIEKTGRKQSQYDELMLLSSCLFLTYLLS